MHLLFHDCQVNLIFSKQSENIRNSMKFRSFQLIYRPHFRFTARFQTITEPFISSHINGNEQLFLAVTF